MSKSRRSSRRLIAVISVKVPFEFKFFLFAVRRVNEVKIWLFVIRSFCSFLPSLSTSEELEEQQAGTDQHFFC